jgi:hypothetical protein
VYRQIRQELNWDGRSIREPTDRASAAFLLMMPEAPESYLSAINNGPYGELPAASRRARGGSIHRIPRCAHRRKNIDRTDPEAIMPSMVCRNDLAAGEGAKGI